MPAPRRASIAQLRREAGLTQRELAARVRCAHSTIGDVESGRLKPSYRLCQRMARALGVTLFELFAPTQSGLRLVQAQPTTPRRSTRE